MKRTNLWLVIAALAVVVGLAVLLVVVVTGPGAGGTSTVSGADRDTLAAADHERATATAMGSARDRGSKSVAAGQDQGAGHASRKAVIYQPGARTTIPRVPPMRPAAGDASPGEAQRMLPRLSEGSGIKDRRDNPDKDSKALMERVEAGLDVVRDEIEQCLAAWSRFDPTIEGDVMLGFTIDPDGLGEVWIQDYADIPAASLTCFSAAVYEVDWAGVTDEPIQITHGFEYRPDAE